MTYRIAASRVTLPDGTVRPNQVVEIDGCVACLPWPAEEGIVRGCVTALHPLAGETPQTVWWGGTLEIHEGFVSLKR